MEAKKWADFSDVGKTVFVLAEEEEALESSHVA